MRPSRQFIMLASQLILTSEGSKVEKAKGELDKALASIDEGKGSEAARHAVRS